MSKILSCGVLYTDGTHILAIKPHGKPQSLDIPKGEIMRGETEAQAASRELYEETGLTIPSEDLHPLGLFGYNHYKDLSLFLYKVSKGNFPSPESLKCTSFFTNHYGKRVPEAVGFEIVELTDDRFYRGLQPILYKLKKDMKF